MDLPGQDKPLKDVLTGLDAGESRAELERRLVRARQELDTLPGDGLLAQRARLELEVAESLLGLGRKEEAWSMARGAFDVLAQEELWPEAVRACDLLYQCDMDDSIAALGNGVWLAVTYPVPPHLTTTLLHHIVDETPPDSDGAAVAAMAAHYIADLRARGREHEDLTFMTSQVVASVAKRHRGIEDEESVKIWIEVLDLNDPEVLISRLGKIIDVIVGDEWWVDRDDLRARLPDN